jgi:hypothetical protein
MDQTSGVVINYPLNVNNDFSAPNIYNKTDVDTALAGKAAQSSTYTKSEVDGLLVTKASTNYVDNALAAKQNTLTFVDPMNLGTLVVGYPLLIGSNIIPRLSVQLPLTPTEM